MKQKSGSSGYVMQEYQQKNGRNGETDLNFTEKRSMLLLDDEQDSNNYFCSNSSSSDSVIQPVALNNLPLGNLLSENEIQVSLHKLKHSTRPLCYNEIAIIQVSLTFFSVALFINVLFDFKENLMPQDKHRSCSTDSDTQDSSIKEAVTQYLSYSGWL
ncbi:hypothetical protein NQ318_022776 [Aromia moschata]|uniref:Uncharacterized protein n=1 Tax=Aromia moschata TaxID=1265417 RepID=A0AAV8YD16_9CUCU|nr:hypothetical protein NQ318_022776 [Aromia moschata]